MIEKRDTCLYCGKKMDSVTAKKRFCCDQHRVYWNRENAKVKIQDLTKQTHEIKPAQQPKTNFSIDTRVEIVPPMPEKLLGENGIDYANRKNEWKRRYG